MKQYISVKKLRATNIKGVRISATIEGTESSRRLELSYDYALSLNDNLEKAAYRLAQEIMEKQGWLIETPVLSMIVNVKTGIPVGFIWEA